jgi:hypothetical protein
MIDIDDQDSMVLPLVKQVGIAWKEVGLPQEDKVGSLKQQVTKLLEFLYN